MLDVDDFHQLSAAEDRNGQKGLVPIFRQLVQQLEARILEGVLADGHRLAMLGDPDGDAQADPQRQGTDDVGMRILRGAWAETVNSADGNTIETSVGK